jgi:hypothetical protein
VRHTRRRLGEDRPVRSRKHVETAGVIRRRETGPSETQRGCGQRRAGGLTFGIGNVERECRKESGTGRLRFDGRWERREGRTDRVQDSRLLEGSTGVQGAVGRSLASSIARFRNFTLILSAWRRRPIYWNRIYERTGALALLRKSGLFWNCTCIVAASMLWSRGA